MINIKRITAFILVSALFLCPFSVSADGLGTSSSYNIDNREFTPGDINGDSSVDLLDIVVLAQFVADWDISYNKYAIDVNGDYLNNLNDVIHLAQYVAGWDDINLSNSPFELDVPVKVEEKLTVYNSEAPLTSQYRGMSGSVYHAYGHMLDDRTGRVYTEEQLETELDRLSDSGVRYARTRYNSAWIWDENGYNWDKNRAGYFYNYCNNLAKRDVNVVLSVGWHLGCFTHKESGSIDEVPYITKSEEYPDDIYGETAGFDFSRCRNDEYRRMAKEALRFAYFYAETIRQTRARGIYNISHFLYWTEPSYATRVPVSSPAYGKEGPTPAEYIFIVQTFQQKLKDEGVYSFVKHIGPNQGSIKHGDGLLRYILERGHTDLFDVWTAHFYPQAANPDDNKYYDICTPVFDSYLATLKEVGIFGKKEFWVDEFYCRSDEVKLGIDNPWAGLQTVVGAICAQQRGINNISIWQIFDQLWTDQTNTGGEFENGIHACGSAPSLFISDIPRRQYYSVGLFARYNGYKNGEAYRTNNDAIQAKKSGIHVGAAKMEDGNWTITVVNAGSEPYKISVDFKKPINQTLYRHTVNVHTIVPTAEAKHAGIDKVFNNVTTDFWDIIAPGSVVIYSGIED